MKRMNLLPKPRQQELRFEQIFHGIVVAVILSTSILLFGVVVQLGVWTYLESSQSNRARQIEVLKQENDKIEQAQQKDQIKLVNNQMSDFLTLTKLTPQWSVALSALAGKVPVNVKITRVIADASSSKVDISGYSPTREAVIELYNSINADKDHFRDINYPLENVARPTDVRFKFTFYIKEGVLTPVQQ